MQNPTPSLSSGLIRRHFLRGAGAVSLLAPALMEQVLLTRAARGESVPDGSGRILVLLELNGGNDTLGTLVPWQNSHYQTARPVLKLAPAQGLLAAGTAPSVAAGMETVAFHPALVKLKQAWDDGDFASVNGVGYPNPNLSHFTSFDYFHTAEPNTFVDDGWLGRFLHERGAAFAPTAAVQIGSRPSLALKSSAGPVPSVTIGSPDYFRWMESWRDDRYSALENVYRQGLGMDRPTGPATASEPGLAAVQAAARATMAGSREMQTTLNRSATRGGFPHTAFPSTELGQNLQQIARQIHGSAPTCLYSVEQGGYDTHGRQIQSGTPALGTHANLLGALDAALGAFIAEMKAQGNWNRVVVCVYSEFGRKVIENGSFGTDHGAAQSVFLLGGAVVPGHFGQLPDLSPAARIKNDSPLPNVDFRRVYRTLLERWLSVPAAAMAPIFPQQPADFSLLGFLP